MTSSLRHRFARTALALASLTLASQTAPKVHETQSWGTRWVATCPAHWRPVNPITLEHPGRPPRQVQRKHPSSSGFVYAQGAFWETYIPEKDPAFQRIEAAGRALIELWVTPDGGTWQMRNLVDLAQGLPETLLPLSDGRGFLGFSPMTAFVKGDTRSTLAVFQPDGTGVDGIDVLTLSEVIPLEVQGVPLYAPVPQDNGPLLLHRTQNHGLDPRRGACADWYAAPIPVGDHYVLIGERTGSVWVIDGTRGTLRHQIDLIPLEARYLRTGMRLTPAVLGAQPTQEGTLLVALRENKAVTESATPAEPTPEEKAAPSAKDLSDRKASLALARFPGIRWVEVDPEKGTVSRASRIDTLEKLESLEQLKRFRFTFSPEGALRGSWNPAPKAGPTPGKG